MKKTNVFDRLDDIDFQLMLEKYEDEGIEEEERRDRFNITKEEDI